MTTAALTQPIKWHGGKHYLAPKIVALMPPRCRKPNTPQPDDPGWLHYVEPYFGGGSVLLAMDPEGISEVANDINSILTNFWRVLQDVEDFKEFLRVVQATPFSERTWEDAAKCPQCMVDFPESKIRCPGCAERFFVRCRQSLSGRMKGFAPLTRARTRSGMNEQASAWLGAVEGLPAIHERLKRVVILNHDALDVIRQQDGPRTLFYLDPPYLHETRATTGEYAHEMTEADHAALLESLVGERHPGGRLQGRFLLSGYRSDLYDSYAERFGWRRTDFDLPNNAAGGGSKRRMTECVWTNY